MYNKQDASIIAKNFKLKCTINIRRGKSWLNF